MALSSITAKDSGRAPKVTMMAGSFKATLDTSYPTGGYSIAAHLPPGVEVISSTPVPHYDGAALRWFQIVNTAGVAMLKAFVNGSGAPGAEVTAAVNLSGHVGVVVGWVGR